MIAFAFAVVVLPAGRRRRASVNSRRWQHSGEVHHMPPLILGIRWWWPRRCDWHWDCFQQRPAELRCRPVRPSRCKTSGTGLATLLAIKAVEFIDLCCHEWCNPHLQQVQAPSPRERQVVDDMASRTESFEARSASIAVGVPAGNVAEVCLGKM